MSKPIPARLMAEFDGWMSAVYDDDSMSDSAWFGTLENMASRFMQQHSLRGDEYGAVMQLLEYRERKEQA